MKKTLFLAVLFFCTSFCRAEEINALVLHLVSGQEVTCLLDNQPVVTFSGEDLVIKSHMSTITYSSADVLKFTYSYVDPSAVNDIKGGGTVFSLDGNVLTAKSLTPGSVVTVYSVDGIKVADGKVSSNGSVTVSIPSHPGATYIVNTSVTNFKITMP